ncbi:MAG: NlpC/P60 family protein [Cytophagales bacterium]|nr:MAG: NlpC/P60 family protein [Cytophagales bacterium]
MIRKGIFYCLLFCILSCKSSKKVETAEVKTKTTSKTSKPKPKQVSKKNTIIDKATMHIGTPYAAGGKNPASGFDCSGFTYYIFQKVDILLPSTAWEQAEKGKAIFINEADKGDLIFFKGGNSKSNVIGHVGIINSNKGQAITFIHASSSKGIMVSALTEKYFKERFIKIRRFL